MSVFVLSSFLSLFFALLTAARGIPAAVAALAPNYFIIITFFSSHLFSWAAWLGGRVFQLYCGWEKCVDVLLIPKDIRDGMALHGLSRCPKDTPNQVCILAYTLDNV
ncbi:hypothetical protein M431DRAFT_512202 [Trichoderma harzianum CBS 226.95]|uniref:Amino acid permease/ SLC12A domain-containing protein n=1 Tax=Trichoderma harzianum CBS 226.95 TaxID=983964 RepID=A0A2T4A0L9_TRIHA|nr:hypothetical protein M431DRAFT_512202 [Trichoderma harzianum CBS 226.95]PTB50606.1 hypothetical protein M431DRAFT_512202 [Trichoderma harzianum CBS 226.95]